MSHVLSLIAARSKGSLTAADVDGAMRAIRAAGIAFAEPIWLAAGEACEIALDGGADSLLAAVRETLSGRPVDVNVLPAAARRKRLLVADMDSTLIEQECIDELAAAAGIGDAIAAITERAMRGEVAFEPALRERVALLGGLPAETVDRVLAERVTMMPGAAILVATMRAHGAHTALVSGGFTSFAEPIAQKLGFNEHRANVLVTEAGRLTGQVAEPILGREAKAETLATLTHRLKLAPAETLAVGDGANDLAMIRLAGLGVAFRAKPVLRAAADAIVDHADLTALLYLQGFRREEFVQSS